MNQLKYTRENPLTVHKEFSYNLALLNDMNNESSFFFASVMTKNVSLRRHACKISLLLSNPSWSKRFFILTKINAREL